MQLVGNGDAKMWKSESILSMVADWPFRNFYQAGRELQKEYRKMKYIHIWQIYREKYLQAVQFPAIINYGGILISSRHVFLLSKVFLRWIMLYYKRLSCQVGMLTNVQPEVRNVASSRTLWSAKATRRLSPDFRSRHSRFRHHAEINRSRILFYDCSRIAFHRPPLRQPSKMSPQNKVRLHIWLKLAQFRSILRFRFISGWILNGFWFNKSHLKPSKEFVTIFE